LLLPDFRRAIDKIEHCRGAAEKRRLADLVRRGIQQVFVAPGAPARQPGAPITTIFSPIIPISAEAAPPGITAMPPL
jgi:hypothetical protein